MNTRHFHGVASVRVALKATDTEQQDQDEIAHAVRLAYALAEDDLRRCFGNHGDFGDEKRFSHALAPLGGDETATYFLLTATCTAWIRYR